MTGMEAFIWFTTTCALSFMLGYLSKPSRIDLRRDLNWTYLRGLLDMKAMYSGCVARDGKTGRYTKGRRD